MYFLKVEIKGFFQFCLLQVLAASPNGDDGTVSNHSPAQKIQTINCRTNERKLKFIVLLVVVNIEIDEGNWRLNLIKTWDESLQAENVRNLGYLKRIEFKKNTGIL